MVVGFENPVAAQRMARRWLVVEVLVAAWMEFPTLRWYWEQTMQGEMYLDQEAVEVGVVQSLERHWHEVVVYTAGES
jgi:hypothetical protein